MSTIGPLVSRDIVSAAPDDSVKNAMQLMHEKRVGAVLLMTGGALEGIFTNHDLLNRVLIQGRDLASTLLRDVATMAPVVVAESASVRECAQIIRQNKFHHVPVTGDDGKVAGVITTQDFLAELASGFEKVIQRVCESSDATECADYYQYVVGDFVD